MLCATIFQVKACPPPPSPQKKYLKGWKKKKITRLFNKKHWEIDLDEKKYFRKNELKKIITFINQL